MVCYVACQALQLIIYCIDLLGRTMDSLSFLVQPAPQVGSRVSEQHKEK